MNTPYFFTRLLLSVTAFVFINACHKPDAEPPDNNEYVVTEIKYDNASSGEQFYYNNNWQLTGKTELYKPEPRRLIIFKHNYTYNNDGRITRVDVSGAADFMYVGVKEMNYNSDGRLVSVAEYGKGTSVLLYLSEYEYNGNKVTRKHYTKSVLDFTCIYTLDDNGNIIKAETDYISVYTPDTFEEWLNYDDKENLLGPTAGDVRSKNNYRQYIMRSTSMSLSGEIVIQYHYKNGKYVDQFIKTGTGGFSSAGKAQVTWQVKK